MKMFPDDALFLHHELFILMKQLIAHQINRGVSQSALRLAVSGAMDPVVPAGYAKLPEVPIKRVRALAETISKLKGDWT